MEAADLTSAEFAYLLATLSCDDVVGLDDPALFPSNASVKGKLFKKGRQELEANGWIVPLPDQPNEYELNAVLLEAVAIIAAPFFMIASTHATDQAQSQLVYHYLTAEHAVELTAIDAKNYRLSILVERLQIFDRIGEMMEIDEGDQTAEVTLEEDQLSNVIQLVNKGKDADSAQLLEEIGMDNAGAKSLLTAISSPHRSALVVVGLEAGEITGGRRVSVYGAGSGAWMAYIINPQTADIQLRTCTMSNFNELLNEFLEELA